MKITGVVSEYNPFHKGHEYQLKAAREKTACDGVVVVMSGNYVQRGEPAIIDKYRRAEAAVHGGADLVIELPMPFSFQNAEMFANAAVKELKKIPVSALSFGCESEDVELLKSIASVQLNPKFGIDIKKEMDKGLSYPSALTNVVVSVLGTNTHDVIGSPNNVLAIEYIKSTIRHNLNCDFAPVKRIGKGHNDITVSGRYDSATAIRKSILSGSSEHMNSLTEKSNDAVNSFYSEFKGFNNLNNYLDIIYYKILELGIDGLNNIYEVSEGLNNKIYENVFKHDNVDDFIMSLKSKRYTYSKLRRMLLNILLDVKKDDIKSFMLTNVDSYIKILAFNNTGRDIIRYAKSNGTYVINRYSDYNKIKIEAEKSPLFKLTNKSTNIYYLPFKDRKTNAEYIKNASYLNIITPR
ncbi:nucleotidyltransferase [Sedimentibacter sp.]|uniref:nucleotidyltransferase n=1 Tax=Sedimentibacter sp. TaxID=1960295 RepID=UPI0028A6DEAE|nr:nucleotidyltransferase [Sedimentibacter sp.]